MHAIQTQYIAEDLPRLLRSNEQQRTTLFQWHSRVDPNSRRIDAVIFASYRLFESGCFLSDEVGLGKSVKADLIVAQRLTESHQRELVSNAVIDGVYNEPNFESTVASPVLKPGARAGAPPGSLALGQKAIVWSNLSSVRIPDAPRGKSVYNPFMFDLFEPSLCAFPSLCTFPSLCAFQDGARRLHLMSPPNIRSLDR